MVEPAPAAPRTQPVNRAFDRAANEAQQPPGPTEENLLAYFKTMDAFLETQRAGDGELPRFARHARTLRPIDGDSRNFRDDARSAKRTDSARRGSSRRRDRSNAAAPDVVEILLEQVSRRTGYPRQMLALDLDMEGDLGIDSIKRVEILGELQARGVVPDGADIERLSRCRTLGQVVQALERSRPTAHECHATPLPWVGDVERHRSGSRARGDSVARRE